MSILNTLPLESKRQIKMNFDGGDLSSDAGLLLIKEFHIGFDPEEIYARSNAIIRRFSGSHADN